MEKGKSSFKILTGEPKGKRPLGRPRSRWVDLEENARNWVASAQDRDN